MRRGARTSGGGGCSRCVCVCVCVCRQNDAMRGEMSTCVWPLSLFVSGDEARKENVSLIQLQPMWMRWCQRRRRLTLLVLTMLMALFIYMKDKNGVRKDWLGFVFVLFVVVVVNCVCPPSLGRCRLVVFLFAKCEWVSECVRVCVCVCCCRYCCCCCYCCCCRCSSSSYLLNKDGKHTHTHTIVVDFKTKIFLPKRNERIKNELK